MAKIMYTHFHECFHAYLRLGLVKFKECNAGDRNKKETRGST